MKAQFSENYDQSYWSPLYKIVYSKYWDTMSWTRGGHEACESKPNSPELGLQLKGLDWVQLWIFCVWWKELRILYIYRQAAQIFFGVCKHLCPCHTTSLCSLLALSQDHTWELKFHFHFPPLSWRKDQCLSWGQGPNSAFVIKVRSYLFCWTFFERLQLLLQSSNLKAHTHMVAPFS